MVALAVILGTTVFVFAIASKDASIVEQAHNIIECSISGMAGHC